MVTLRTAAPPLAFQILRNVAKYFPTPDAEYKLDPGYEPADDSSTPDHEKVFADLQGMRNAGLVVPVGAEHMYYAAMNKKSCRLTPLGRYYWRLAKMKKFGVDVTT